MPIKKSVGMVFLVSLLLAIAVSAYGLNDILNSNLQYYDEFYQGFFFGENRITGSVVAGQDVVASYNEPATSCGDGSVNNGEECEANSDCGSGEYCRLDCTCQIELETISTSFCGDGKKDPGEACGEPGLTCPKGTDTCSKCQCLSNNFVSSCGNGKKDPGEECGDKDDNGNDMTCWDPKATCQFCKCYSEPDTGKKIVILPYHFGVGSGNLWINAFDSFMSDFKAVGPEVRYLDGGSLFVEVPDGYDFEEGDGSIRDAHHGGIGNVINMKGKGVNQNSYAFGVAERVGGSSQGYMSTDLLNVDPERTYIKLGLKVDENTASSVEFMRLLEGTIVVASARIEGNQIIFDVGGKTVQQSLAGGWNSLEFTYGTFGSSLGNKKMNTLDATEFDRVHIGFFGGSGNDVVKLSLDELLVFVDNEETPIDTITFDKSSFSAETALMTARDYADGAYFVIGNIDIVQILNNLKSSNMYSELNGVVVDLDRSANPAAVINNIRSVDGDLEIGVKLRGSSSIGLLASLNPDFIVYENMQAVDEARSKEAQKTMLVGAGFGYGSASIRGDLNNIVQSINVPIYILPNFIDNGIESINENYNIDKSIFLATAITETRTSSAADIADIRIINKFSTRMKRDHYFRFNDRAEVDFESSKIVASLFLMPFTIRDVVNVPLANVEDMSYEYQGSMHTIPEISAFAAPGGYLLVINRLDKVQEIKVDNLLAYDTIDMYRLVVGDILSKDQLNDAISEIKHEELSVNGDYSFGVAPGLTLLIQTSEGRVIEEPDMEWVCEGTSFLPFFNFDTRYGCKLTSDERILLGLSPCVYTETFVGGKCETYTGQACSYWNSDPVSCEISAYSAYPTCQFDVEANICVNERNPLYITGSFENGILKVTYNLEANTMFNGEGIEGIQFRPETVPAAQNFVGFEAGKMITDLGANVFVVNPVSLSNLLFGAATIGGNIFNGGEFGTYIFGFDSNVKEVLVKTVDVIGLDGSQQQVPIVNVAEKIFKETEPRGDFFITIDNIAGDVVTFSYMRSIEVTGIQLKTLVPGGTIQRIERGEAIVREGSNVFTIDGTLENPLVAASGLAGNTIKPGILWTFSALIPGGVLGSIIGTEQDLAIINGQQIDIEILDVVIEEGGEIVPIEIPPVGIAPDLNDLDGDGVLNSLDCDPLNKNIGATAADEICINNKNEKIVCPSLNCEAVSPICISDGEGGYLEAVYATTQLTTYNTITGFCEPRVCDPIAVQESVLCMLTLECIDIDGDGFGLDCPSGVDCNDNDATIFPGAVEAPDGLDNNCNGEVDEGFECVNGATQECGASNEGECSKGTQTCTNGQFGSCVGEVKASPDNNCNGLDDDCDGLIDEGYVVTATSCGVGACGATGGLTCVDGNVVDTCQAGSSNVEVCDGLDNDCNGQVDEGISSVPTSCGVGACGATGSTSCVNGALVNSCNVNAPGVEVCDANGIDEDCDGQVNEGCGCKERDLQTCGTGIGKCETGTRICGIDGKYGVCQGNIGPDAAETCGNNVDDNCNGQIDEGCNVDSDGDGVLDANDKCPNTPNGRPVNLVGCPGFKAENLGELEIPLDLSNINLNNVPDFVVRNILGKGRISYLGPIKLIDDATKDVLDLKNLIIITDNKVRIENTYPQLITTPKEIVIITSKPEILAMSDEEIKVLKDGGVCTTCSITLIERTDSDGDGEVDTLKVILED
jgi:hypothetical protein